MCVCKGLLYTFSIANVGFKIFGSAPRLIRAREEAEF